MIKTETKGDPMSIRTMIAAMVASSLLHACVAVGGAERPRASADRFEAHVKFLADDRLEGREAGSPGHEIAALYVAEQLRGVGLEPMGEDGTYHQQVPLRASSQGADHGGSLAFSVQGPAIAMRGGDDYVVSPSPEAERVVVEGALVFVGYGVHAPERGHDDFAGLDLKGKIAVRAYGAPSGLDTEEAAHHRASGTAAAAAAERGAVGLITIWSPNIAKRFGFERYVAQSAASSSMTWLDADGDPFDPAPGLDARAAIDLASAQRLFDAAAPGRWAEILAVLEREDGDLPRFPLEASARIEARAKHEDVRSPNVVALLPGTDRDVAGEYVVVSAHLDHVGLSAADAGGDVVNNGAMDNAVGTAAMLETARLLAARGGLRRPVLFVAVTAEEKGLVGADYFARNPSIPSGRLAANVNLDMPIINYDFTDITAFGAERSNLLPAVQAAADASGVRLTPDPAPEEGLFTRSDQYAFVRQGVPAVYLKTGYANGGEAAQKQFRAERYHRPSDEADDYVLYDVGAKFADLNAEIIARIANMGETPAWNDGDFFGELFEAKD